MLPGHVQCTFVQYLIAFCSRPEAASDVLSGRFVSPIVPDKCEKFSDPHLNHSGAIPPEAVAGGIFGRFSNFNKCRSEVSGDVILGKAVE